MRTVTQYNEQQHEYGPGYVMVAAVQRSKGRERNKGGCVASVVIGDGLMCVCVGGKVEGSCSMIYSLSSLPRSLCLSVGPQ